MEITSQDITDKQEEIISLDDFLTDEPIGKSCIVTCRTDYVGLSSSAEYIRQFCKNCDAIQYFDIQPEYSDSWTESNRKTPFRVSLVCRNCLDYNKMYLVGIYGDTGRGRSHYHPALRMEKLIEYPRDFKKISDPELSLLGNERDDFFKGLGCERDGLGVAAFLYYRRVIEKRRDKIFDSLIKAIKETVSNNKELIKELELIKKDGQFIKSANTIKAAFPDSLLIVGQNPLYLLYGLLSAGIHNMSDEECLVYAKDARLVLLKLSEKIDALLKESKELKGAVGRLVTPKDR